MRTGNKEFLHVIGYEALPGDGVLACAVRERNRPTNRDAMTGMDSSGCDPRAPAGNRHSIAQRNVSGSSLYLEHFIRGENRFHVFRQPFKASERMISRSTSG